MERGGRTIEPRGLIFRISFRDVIEIDRRVWIEERKRKKGGNFFQTLSYFFTVNENSTGGFSHGEGAKKKYRSIDITDIWIYQRDTVKRDRDEYWIAR